jgi:hypothetical protein
MFSPTRRFAETSVCARLEIRSRNSGVPLTDYQKSVDDIYDFTSALDDTSQLCLYNISAFATHLPSNTIFDLIQYRPSSVPDFTTLPIEGKYENDILNKVTVIDENQTIVSKTPQNPSPALSSLNAFLTTSPLVSINQDDPALVDILKNKLGRSDVSLKDINTSSLSILLPVSLQAFEKKKTLDASKYYTVLDKRYGINSKNVQSSDALILDNLVSRLVQLLLAENYSNDNFNDQTVDGIEREIKT